MAEVSTYQGEGVNEAGDPAHVHEMLAKVEEPIEAYETEDELYTRDESRPEWLPEKFSSAEEMAQAYKNLEQQFHSGSEEREQQEEEQRFQDEEVPEIQGTTPSQVHQLLDDRGLDFAAFQEEYNSTGELSAEALAALEEAGISQEVGDYLLGEACIEAKSISDLFMSSHSGHLWRQLENLDANTQLAVSGLYARYQNSEGVPPSLMSGEFGQDVAPRYESLAQVTSAMSDPRYQSDPAYRAKVAQRLGNSQVL